MNRRTFTIAVTSFMLAVGVVAAFVQAAEPTAPTPNDSSSRAGGTAGTPTATPSPSPSPTPTPTPTPTAPASVPAPPPEAPAPAPPAADPMEAEVLALVNAQRAANGCGPVSGDEGLAGVARAHSADMAARDYFSHTTPEGVDPFQRAAAAGQSASAENIAAGQQTAAAVMGAWMNSPGHRANILNCSLGRLGVGVGYGGSYGIYWTQLFG